MSGLLATLAELEPCFPILLMSSIVASSEQKSRALFEYTWVPGKTSDGRAVPRAPSVAASGRSRLCPKLRYERPTLRKAYRLPVYVTGAPRGSGLT